MIFIFFLLFFILIFLIYVCIFYLIEILNSTFCKSLVDLGFSYTATSDSLEYFKNIPHSPVIVLNLHRRTVNIQGSLTIKEYKALNKKLREMGWLF